MSPSSVVFVTATGRGAESKKSVPITRRAGEAPEVVMSLRLEGPRPGSALLAAGDVLRVGVELEVTVDGETAGDAYGKPYGYSPRVAVDLLLASDDEAAKADAGAATRIGGARPVTVGHSRHHHVAVIDERHVKVGAAAEARASSHLNVVLGASHPDAADGQVLLVGENEANGAPPKKDKGRINVVRFRPRRRAGHRTKTAAARSARVALQKGLRTLVYSLPLPGLAADEQLWLRARLVTRSALDFPARISTEVFLTDGPTATDPGHYAVGVSDFHAEIAKFNGFNCLAGETCHSPKLGVMRMRRDADRTLYANLVATGTDPFHQGDGGEALEVVGGGFIEAIRYPPSWIG